MLISFCLLLTLSPLLKLISTILPVVWDLMSMLLLWIVWPWSVIDWSIGSDLKTFVSTLINSLNFFSELLVFSVSVEFVAVYDFLSSALTFPIWPDNNHPEVTNNIQKANSSHKENS